MSVNICLDFLQCDSEKRHLCLLLAHIKHGIYLILSSFLCTICKSMLPKLIIIKFCTLLSLLLHAAIFLCSNYKIMFHLLYISGGRRCRLFIDQHKIVKAFPANLQEISVLYCKFDIEGMVRRSNSQFRLQKGRYQLITFLQMRNALSHHNHDVKVKFYKITFCQSQIFSNEHSQ